MWEVLRGAEEAGWGVLGRKTLNLSKTDGWKAFFYYSEPKDVQWTVNYTVGRRRSLSNLNKPNTGPNSVMIPSEHKSSIKHK